MRLVYRFSPAGLSSRDFVKRDSRLGQSCSAAGCVCIFWRIHEHMSRTPARRSGVAQRVPTLTELRKKAAGCTACSLYKNATQTVFGEGPEHARIMMIGEQPGDQEDRQGHPFVGPAGTLLNKALAAVGISRDEVYVTNIVKHFKWEPRGKRRIH